MKTTIIKIVTDEDMCLLAARQHERAVARRALTAEEWRAISCYLTLVGNYVRDDVNARRMHDLSRDALDRANAIDNETENKSKRKKK